MLAVFVLSVFPLMLIYAAISDLTTMRIPNSIPVSLFCAFLILAFFGEWSLWLILQHLGIGFLVLCITFFFFSFGWMGGGDAKLLASIALWFGPQDVLSFLLVTAVYGGFLTFFILIFRAYPLFSFLESWAWVRNLHHKEKKVPYGVAISIAGLSQYPSQLFFNLL